MFLTILPDTKTHTSNKSLISYSYQRNATMFNFINIQLLISSFVCLYSFLSLAASWIDGLCSLGIFSNKCSLWQTCFNHRWRQHYCLFHSIKTICWWCAWWKWGHSVDVYEEKQSEQQQETKIKWGERKWEWSDQGCIIMHVKVGHFGHTHSFKMNGYEWPKPSFFQNTVVAVVVLEM